MDAYKLADIKFIIIIVHISLQNIQKKSCNQVKYIFYVRNKLKWTLNVSLLAYLEHRYVT